MKPGLYWSRSKTPGINNAGLWHLVEVAAEGVYLFSNPVALPLKPDVYEYVPANLTDPDGNPYNV